MTALTTRLSGMFRRIMPGKPVRVSADKAKQARPTTPAESTAKRVKTKTAAEAKPDANPKSAAKPSQQQASSQKQASSQQQASKVEPSPQPKAEEKAASAQATDQALEVLEPGQGDNPRRSGLISRISGNGNKNDDRNGDGYTEVVDLMHNVRDRLDEQSERSDRMMEIMARLPEAIDALPETNRNQARMLEALQTHLERQDRQATTLNKSLGELAQATEHQSQVMSVIQQQIDTNHKTDQEMLRGFGAMSSTLERLNDNSHLSSQALAKVTEQSKTADQSIQKLIKTNTRNMTILSAASWALALAAMGAAIYAGWAVTVGG